MKAIVHFRYGAPDGTSYGPARRAEGLARGNGEDRDAGNPEDRAVSDHGPFLTCG